MITIAILNSKGGVGKTSTTVHLGGTLARMNKRVLWVDADPQGSTTQGRWGPRAFEELNHSNTLAACLDGDPLPEQVIHKSGIENIWIIPAHDDMRDLNILRPDEYGERRFGIRNILGEVGDEFDFAIIDCPPHLHFCAHAAMVAASHVIVPMQSEDYGAQGLVTVRRAVSRVAAEHGRPDTLGYLLTMFDRRLQIHNGYAAQIRDAYPGLVFGTEIPSAAAYKEAVVARMPISHHKPKSAAAKAYVALAGEIEARITPCKTEAA